MDISYDWQREQARLRQAAGVGVGDAVIRYVGADDQWHVARLTCDDPRSSYGRPMLVLDNGEALGPSDIIIRMHGKRMLARDFVAWKRDGVIPGCDYPEHGGYSEQPAEGIHAALALVDQFIT